MEGSKLKNMVILKNLPSNLAEEAIVILKENKKLKRLEKIDNNKKVDCSKINNKEQDYVLKEAEMLVTNYINKLENKKRSRDINNKIINKKIRKLKVFAACTSIITIIETMLLIIK